MVVINKSKANRYSLLADRELRPGGRSADMDMGGLCQALKDVVDGCGSSFLIRLSDEERRLVHRLIELDEAGMAYKSSAVQAPTQAQLLMRREEEAKRQKMASIAKARAHEESIMAETTYTSRKDMDAAKERAGRIKGDVEAKKLDEKKSEQVSLKDLMGDNKFIEESMKHSGIKTAVASEEGWDMDKMNEGREAPAAAEAEAEPAGAAEIETKETKGTTTAKKKSSRRRQRKSE